MTNTHVEPQRRKPPGLIETLSLAFGAVARRMWLLLLPLGLDVLLWRGPLISPEPLFRQAATLFAVPPELANQQAELAAQMETFQEALLEMGRQFNILSLLVVRTLGMPSLLADAPSLAGPHVVRVVVAGGGMALTVSLAVGLLGLFLTCLWLMLLGRTAWQTLSPDEQGAQRPLMVGATRTAVRLLLLLLVLVGALVALMLPASAMLALVTVMSPGVGVALSSLLSLVFLWIGLWVGLHLYFVVEAMVLYDDGVVQAVTNSFRVVRRYFWSSLGLILLVVLIGQGFHFIWLRVARTLPGLVLAIAGNAFLGTGLTLAAFLFYQERFQRLAVPPPLHVMLEEK
ncbi:MAG: hypothetical protein Q9O62_06615 [Ardenticatenia bacterium]|nr:hypothetical protein [Ardenticatenia bacterium]